jgi:hypothetical protein
MSLLFGAGFSSTEKYMESKLISILFNVPDVCYRVPKPSIPDLISSGLMG